MRDPSYWFVLLFLLLLGSGIRYTMFNRLRTVAPELWRQLGEPAVFNGDVKRHLLELRFLLRARYLEIQDRRLTVFSVIYSVLYFAAWALFILLLLQQWSPKS